MEMDEYWTTIMTRMVGKGFSFDEIKKMDIFEFYHVLNRLEKDAEK
jgi:hypothetical protein